MINLWSGTPGSGKSYHMADELYHRLRFKKNYICNFPINLDIVNNGGKKVIGKFTYVKTFDMSPRYFIDYAKHNHEPNKEHQTTIVIDECGRLFNPQFHRSQAILDWIEFFTLHRHIGYDVILIAQQDKFINKQIRGLIENEIVHRKITKYKLWGKILGLLFHGNVFMTIEKWYSVPRSPKIDSNIYVLRKKIASIYDTHMDFYDKE